MVVAAVGIASMLWQSSRNEKEEKDEGHQLAVTASGSHNLGYNEYFILYLHVCFDISASQ